jgi:hypothetical protein
LPNAGRQLVVQASCLRGGSATSVAQKKVGDVAGLTPLAPNVQTAQARGRSRTTSVSPACDPERGRIGSSSDSAPFTATVTRIINGGRLSSESVQVRLLPVASRPIECPDPGSGPPPDDKSNGTRLDRCRGGTVVQRDYHGFRVENGLPEDVAQQQIRRPRPVSLGYAR